MAQAYPLSYYHQIGKPRVGRMDHNTSLSRRRELSPSSDASMPKIRQKLDVQPSRYLLQKLFRALLVQLIGRLRLSGRAPVRVLE